MNRAELIEKVKDEVGLSRGQAESAVETLLSSVLAAVTSGERVSLFGFGTFHPSSRAARTGRNPRTGEAVKIPPSQGVRFAPSVAFKAALNPRAAGKKASATKQAAKPPTPRAAAATKGPTAKKAPAKAAAKKATTSTKKR